MAESAKELLNYKQQVEAAMKEEKSVFFFNDSILKAMMIQRCILGGGEEQCMPPCVRMYCGRGSLFLSTGRTKALNAKSEVDVEGLSSDVMAKWGQLDVWKELRNALEAFLKENRRLELIVDNAEDIRLDAELWQILRTNCQNVSVFHLPVNVGLDHFTTSMESYRVENSDHDKTATCAFHDKENARIFYDSFNVLKRFSVPVLVQ